jgi:hypothetical protein
MNGILYRVLLSIKDATISRIAPMEVTKRIVPLSRFRVMQQMVRSFSVLMGVNVLKHRGSVMGYMIVGTLGTDIKSHNVNFCIV